jgi:hypothetical protein
LIWTFKKNSSSWKNYDPSWKKLTHSHYDSE